MVEVEVRRIIKQPYPLVVLQEKTGDASLQIVIGPFEALAISLAHSGQVPPRPVSYDLARHILEEVDSSVQRVEITDLNEGIYYAELHLKDTDGAVAIIDSRPSDAIAIALRTGAPIYADPALFEDGTLQPMTVHTEAEAVPSPKQQNAASAVHQTPGPRIDQLRKRLDHAILEEAYEEAARLRDEISRLQRTKHS